MKNSKILIDFSGVKTGGGVQLATNFLLKLKENNKEGYVLLLPDVGDLSTLDFSIPNYVTPSGKPLRRIFFENFVLPKILSKEGITTCFTFFGAGLPKRKAVFSIVSVAYPTICYDESPYWTHLSLMPKMRKKILNYFRIQRLKKADLILAETEIMRARLLKVLKMPDDKIKTVPPAPSAFVEDLPYRGVSKPYRFLFLGGTDQQKNIWRLVEIAEQLVLLEKEFKFVLSVEKEAFRRLKHSIPYQEELVKTHFEFVGAVHPTAIGKLYDDVDFLVNLSDLESFTNNYMEAWKTGTPLIVSDRDFARHLCKDSALFVEPHHPKQVARAIFEHLKQEDTIQKMVESGKDIYCRLPSQEEKFKTLIRIVNEKKVSF